MCGECTAGGALNRELPLLRLIVCVSNAIPCQFVQRDELGGAAATRCNRSGCLGGVDVWACALCGVVCIFRVEAMGVLGAW